MCFITTDNIILVTLCVCAFITTVSLFSDQLKLFCRVHPKIEKVTISKLKKTVLKRHKHWCLLPAELCHIKDQQQSNMEAIVWWCGQLQAFSNMMKIWNRLSLKMPQRKEKCTKLCSMDYKCWKCPFKKIFICLPKWQFSKMQIQNNQLVWAWEQICFAPFTSSKRLFEVPAWDMRCSKNTSMHYCNRKTHSCMFWLLHLSQLHPQQPETFKLVIRICGKYDYFKVEIQRYFSEFLYFIWLTPTIFFLL